MKTEIGRKNPQFRQGAKMNNEVTDCEIHSELTSTSGLPEELIITLAERLKRVTSYVPTVAFFGATGAGKTRLCNALFGRDLFKVSHVRSETRTPQRERIRIFGVEIDLLDFPGIGESREYDQKYREIYRTYATSVDVVLWLIKVDDRALAKDTDFFNNVVRPSGIPEERLLFVVTQIDKAEKLRDWDDKLQAPGESQRRTIREKVDHLREVFEISPSSVIPVSADLRYNIKGLAARIVQVCPDEAALNLSRTLEKEARNEEVGKTVFRKVLDFCRSAASPMLSRAADALVSKAVERVLVRFLKL